MRRRAQGFTLIEIMVVIAIIAGLVTTVAIVVPKMQDQQKRLGCMQNLSQLGQIFISNKMENPVKAQRYSGVALWLNMRKGAKDIVRGNEKVLICPGDQGIAVPETDDDKKKWDNVDLDNPPSDLCSYAARDFKNFPINVESPEKEIIGSDRQGADQRTMQHKGGIVCCYTEGDAQFVTRDELGVNTENPIVVGPDADNKNLKKVVYVVRKKD
jgi:prepilin-type N-terminal cleavage/methylation domain-containing protein